MLLEILNNTLVLLYVMACLNVARHLFFFLQTYFTDDETRSKYIITPRSLLLLGTSAAYVISGMIMGITVH